MTRQCIVLDKQTETKSPLCGNFIDGQESSAVVSQKQLTLDKTLEDKLSGPTASDILTKREIQILDYIIAGNTNKEIAQKLYRTQRTVEYHRNRLMRKLDTHTTAELVKRAILMGLV